ncbi:MAG TPA: bifunctional phosphopantothenoylcysteine decarboxylase/phosphopantothenate--cysteine ligase CoaBC [Actinomycetes bacterium]|nr:bifunctional phosphopantothenoylcysteine decarboxylase/phosphopantothenate--cysteine ligase CoaBC [Actinomycetes bacterium]
MARIVLGVGGGIAAYKACDLLRRLTEAGHSVRVAPTQSALNFVGVATWAALSGQPVTGSVFDDVDQVPHVRLGQEADLVVVAPATANLLAKAAHGFADDLLTNVLLTARCPVLFAPAMHTEMWEHPATAANVALLRQRGVTVLEPAVGRLTGVDTGKGRLPDPEQLANTCEHLISRGSQTGTLPIADLAGRRVVVSAGGTREALDPVRYLGNRSSGRQGYALAAAAAGRGAQVVLVSANVDLPDPAGVEVRRVTSAAELREVVTAASAEADAVVMAAAVADFRPAVVSAHKIKKDQSNAGDAADDYYTLRLTRNPDVLVDLVTARRRGQVIVGFGAETGDDSTSWLEFGRRKLAVKGCDLLVVNEVGDGLAFGTADNAAVILGSDGSETQVEKGPKQVLADVVWDLVAARLT